MATTSVFRVRILAATKKSERRATKLQMQQEQRVYGVLDTRE